MMNWKITTVDADGNRTTVVVQAATRNEALHKFGEAHRGIYPNLDQTGVKVWVEEAE